MLNAVVSGAAVILAALIAAFIAFLTNSQSQRATDVQLQIADQGLITDRYNAAITNLGSHSIEVRLGGIYALQGLMQDSPRDQPTVIAVLCAFVRNEAVGNAAPRTSAAPPLPTDAQAALTVVGTRNTANDGRTTVVDFDHAQLANAKLNGTRFPGANFFGAQLSHAELVRARLRDAHFSSADLTSTNLAGANLNHAHLSSANLEDATLDTTNLAAASLHGANLTGASLHRANLRNANLHGANLTGADLTNANLRGTDLRDANLTRADLTGALWLSNASPPAGWQRGPAGRLQRAAG